MPNSESYTLINRGKEQALSFVQRLYYSTGHVLNDLLASMWFSYLLIYLHEVQLFDNFLAGNLMLIGQVVDAVCTPFIGYESDRTRTGFCGLGRRKSWHIVGVISVLASFSFLFQPCFNCEHSESIYKFVYYIPFVVIFQFGWAATQISHLAYSSEISPYELERSKLQSYRNAFTIFANVFVYGVFSIMFIVNSDSAELGPKDEPKFRNLTFISMGVGVFFMLIFYGGTSTIKRTYTKAEAARIAAEEAAAPQNNGSIEDGPTPEPKPAVKFKIMTPKDWLKEIKFYQIALVYMCSRLYINVSQVYFGLYLTETLKTDKNRIALLPLCSYFGSLIASLIVPYSHKYMGKKLTHLLGSVIGLGSCVWLYFLPHKNNQVFPAGALMGISGAILLVTIVSLTSDFIGDDSDTGAFVFGAMSFTDKLSNGIAIFIIQKLHPCKNCCPACEPYYRDVQTFVPGIALVVGIIGLATLIDQNVGERSENSGTSVNPQLPSTSANTFVCPCGVQCSRPGLCVQCTNVLAVTNEEEGRSEIQGLRHSPPGGAYSLIQ